MKICTGVHDAWNAGIAEDCVGWAALIVLHGSVMNDPKTRIDLRRIRIGRIGGDQAEAASRVCRKGLSVGVTSFMIVHLKDLQVVSDEWCGMGRRSMTYNTISHFLGKICLLRRPYKAIASEESVHQL